MIECTDLKLNCISFVGTFFILNQVALAASDCLLVVESRDSLYSAKPKPHIDTEEVIYYYLIIHL